MYLISTSASCVCQEMVSTAPCMHHKVEVVKDRNVLKHMEASHTLQALNVKKSCVTAHKGPTTSPLTRNTAKWFLFSCFSCKLKNLFKISKLHTCIISCWYISTLCNSLVQIHSIHFIAVRLAMIWIVVHQVLIIVKQFQSQNKKKIIELQQIGVSNYVVVPM